MKKSRLNELAEETRRKETVASKIKVGRVAWRGGEGGSHVQGAMHGHSLHGCPAWALLALRPCMACFALNV